MYLSRWRARSFFVELVLLQYDLVQSRPSMVVVVISATRLTPEEDPYVD